MLFFGGALGVGYIYRLSQIDEDTDMSYLHGHFGEITRLVYKNKLIFTASKDFSVRIWDSDYAVQLCLLLDINCENSEIISLVS